MTTAEVKLLTLLNVSAIKRPRDLDRPGGFRSPSLPGSRAESPEEPAGKKRRRSVVFGGEVGPSGSTFGKKAKEGKKAAVNGASSSKVEQTETVEIGQVEDNDEEDGADSFNTHFGAESAVLSPEVAEKEERGEWETERSRVKGLGRVVDMRLQKASESRARLIPTIASAVSSQPPLVSTLLSHLGTYTDLYAHSMDGEADGSEARPFASGTHDALRSAAAAHAINHVLKTRRRIVRNNERLAHASANGEDLDPPRDQAFTRPKVLFLLPTRAAALHWLKDKVFPLAPAGTQIENAKPFTSSFSLPDGAEDPLDGPSDFPPDHVENFRGNSDDNFRLGLKLTRKAWRVVMPPANEDKLLDCDVLIASPLAIKMGAEREDSTDMLASIEICVVDGCDVLAMQNWDHVQFVFKHLNEIPKSPHGCDFSRVKPWYLEGNAKLLRQTLMFGRYDMPEVRNLLLKCCHNVAGKQRTDADLAGVLDRVRPGVRQVFERIDASAPRGDGAMSADASTSEVDARFEYFTKKALPALLRSATTRAQTLLVIPSYFDFVRVTNYLRKADSVTYAAISEYSSNAEIGRARTLFFKGKRALLVVTERFHFYRRYRLRGAKTVVFYQLPQHAQFYPELLSTPFIGSGGKEEDIDPAEIQSRVLFSRFDVLRLERVVGRDGARRMLGGDERFEFV